MVRSTLVSTTRKYSPDLRLCSAPCISTFAVVLAGSTEGQGHVSVRVFINRARFQGGLLLVVLLTEVGGEEAVALDGHEQGAAVNDIIPLEVQVGDVHLADDLEGVLVEAAQEHVVKDYIHTAQV